MADFSFLSDADDSAVEEIISQATDLSILEQVAAINCSAFSDSVLPTELETRFSKLKSFPSSKKFGLRTELKTRSARRDDDASVFSPSKQNPCGRAKGSVGFSPGEGEPDGKSAVSSPSKQNGGDEENAVFSPGKENPEGNFTGSKRNVILSPSKQYPDENFTGSKKNVMFSPSKQAPTEKKSGSRNPNSGFLSSPSSDSSDFSMDSPSPPQKTGCFLCSPKSLPPSLSQMQSPLGLHSLFIPPINMLLVFFKTGCFSSQFNTTKNPPDSPQLSTQKNHPSIKNTLPAFRKNQRGILYMEPQSPPRQVCCFWYSSKRSGNRKKRKSSPEVSLSNMEDVNLFSVEEQERMLKVAMKEEERISKEAERVVTWVKQESARMDVSAVNKIINDG